MITAGLLSTTELVATMRASIRGDVVTAEQPSFPAATFGVAGVAPELVVVAADVTDVARAVALAGRTGRRVVAQITGRPTVVATDHTILVVTRLLATVRVDADRRTATIGIGASWRQVLDTAEPFGLTALSGARRGPVSVADRPRATAFAFAADRIRSFEVVTTTGDRRLVGPNSPEFAALRRGQTAPGLVVGMTLELVRQPVLTGAELTFTAADAAAALAGWRRWSTDLPPTAVTGVAAGPAGRTLTIRLTTIGEPGRANRLLAALRSAVGVIPMAEWAGPATMAAIARGSAGRPDLAA